jgi:hypothetical protein
VGIVGERGRVEKDFGGVGEETGLHGHREMNKGNRFVGENYLGKVSVDEGIEFG